MGHTGRITVVDGSVIRLLEIKKFDNQSVVWLDILWGVAFERGQQDGRSYSQLECGVRSP